MAKIYAKLICKGIINPKTNNVYTIEDIPDEKLREQVVILLEE